MALVLPAVPVATVPPGLRRAVLAASLVLALLGVLALLTVLSGTGRAVPRHGPEDGAAARAVADLTGPTPERAVVPADLAAVVGNPVTRAAGRPVVGPGGCSAPVPLLAAFHDACRAHDLGYDLLRYAAARGAPLGPWARRAVDARLAADLASACEAGGPWIAADRCRFEATAAGAVVRANSWRQGDGVPVHEAPERVVAGTVVTVGATALGIAR